MQFSKVRSAQTSYAINFQVIIICEEVSLYASIVPRILRKFALHDITLLLLSIKKKIVRALNCILSLVIKPRLRVATSTPFFLYCFDLRDAIYNHRRVTFFFYSLFTSRYCYTRSLVTAHSSRSLCNLFYLQQ